MTISLPGARVVARRRTVVRAFLRLLETKNIDAWIGLWAADGEQRYPYGTEMFPPHLAGRAAIHDRWRNLPDQFDSLRFPIREVWSDGDTVLVRFDGACVPKGGGPTYRNSYLSIFKFDAADKVVEYAEYFDPIPAGVGFGLMRVEYLTD